MSSLARDSIAADRQSHRSCWPHVMAYGPVLVAVLYFLPRLMHAQFGLLDDAMTLSASRTVLAHPSESLFLFRGQGRFLPAYLIYWALVYLAGGESPLWFYLGNLALFTLTVAALIAVLRRLGAGVFETWAAGLFFIFTGAAAESYFTLSKGEPELLLSLLASLLVAHHASRSRWPLVNWTLASLLMLAAMTSREPAAAWIGVVGAWLLLSLWRGAGEPAFLPRQQLAVYFLVLLAGVAPVLLARALLHHSFPAASYSSGYRFTWLNISQSLRQWSCSLMRDFPGLCLFLICAAILAWRRRIGRPQALRMALVWMAGFAAILLPWNDYHPYYQLMFSAGASLFCGLMAGECLAAARQGQPWARAVLAAAAILLGVAVVDSANAARFQIQVDDANTELVERLAKLPLDSLLLVNFPFQTEYAAEIQQHLAELRGRPDLRVRPLDYSAPDPRDAGHARFVVSQNLEHEFRPPVRGPMPETGVPLWNGYWQEASAAGAHVAFQATRTWPMANIGLQVFACNALEGWSPKFAAVCNPLRRPLADMRQTSYGWSVYSAPPWKAPVEAAAFTADGAWSIAQPSGEPVRLAFGRPGDVPVAADWNGDGLLEPGIYRPSSNTWMVDLSLDGRPGLVFQLPGMQPGDVPVAGRWRGLKAGPGFYRPADNTWHLFFSPQSRAEDLPVFHFGIAGSIPLAGDWDHDSYATPGLYQPETGTVTLIDSFREDATRVVYTLPPGVPVVVNWSGAGVDTVNTIDHGKWNRRFANCPCVPANPVPELVVPPVEGRPFEGRWKKP